MAIQEIFMNEETKEITSSALSLKIEETDRLLLEISKQKRLTALANAEKALAQNEAAELAYKYVVLQLYVKYSLTSEDALNEDGSIIKGGAKVPLNK